MTVLLQTCKNKLLLKSTLLKKTFMRWVLSWFPESPVNRFNKREISGSGHWILPDHLQCSCIDDQGYVTLTWENQKFWLENQMIHAILFRELQKIWAVIWGDAIFYTFSHLFKWFGHTLWLVALPHHIKFYSWVHSFTRKISTQVVCVNGKHSSFLFQHQSKMKLPVSHLFSTV